MSDAETQNCALVEVANALQSHRAALLGVHCSIEILEHIAAADNALKDAVSEIRSAVAKMQA